MRKMFSEKDTDPADASLRTLIEAVRAGRFEPAIEGLKTFLSVQPRNEIATGLLAASYFQIGLLDRAQALYERVLELNPLNALARFQLGMTQLSLRAPRAALTTWEPLLETQNEFMARFHSALAHLELGERGPARTLLDEAAKNMPASHPLAGRLRALRSQLGAAQTSSMSIST